MMYIVCPILTFVILIQMLYNIQKLGLKILTCTCTLFFKVTCTKTFHDLHAKFLKGGVLRDNFEKKNALFCTFYCRGIMGQLGHMTGQVVVICSVA